MLYSGLEYLEEPRELERLATPFGGGMRMGDHCGFFCAGLMLVGLACAGLKDGKKVSAEIQKTFTEYWKKNWPLTCRDIKAAMKDGKIQGGCTAIGKSAGAELGKLLEPLVGDPSRIRFATKPRV
jgi:hypothetical protein